MNLSKQSLICALMILPLAVGCGKHDGDDTNGDNGTTGDNGTEGTRAPDFYEPTGFFVDGIFAFDAVNNEIGPFTNPDLDDQIPTQVLITLQDDNGDTCETLITTLTVLPAPAWLSTESAYAGFTLDDAVTVQSNCTDLDFDPGVFGTADELVDRIAAFTWGLGVSDLPDSDDLPIASSLEDAVVSQLDQQAWNDDWAPFVVGGGFHVISGADDPGQYLNFDFTFGFEIDENRKLTFVDVDNSGDFNPPDSGEGDTLTPLAAADIEDGTTPSGVYNLSAFFGAGVDGVFTQ